MDPTPNPRIFGGNNNRALADMVPGGTLDPIAQADAATAQGQARVPIG